jgi:hypothetical protein
MPAQAIVAPGAGNESAARGRALKYNIVVGLYPMEGIFMEDWECGVS